jgi:hypothetical protein
MDLPSLGIDLNTPRVSHADEAGPGPDCTPCDESLPEPPARPVPDEPQELRRPKKQRSTRGGNLPHDKLWAKLARRWRVMHETPAPRPAVRVHIERSLYASSAPRWANCAAPEGPAETDADLVAVLFPTQTVLAGRLQLEHAPEVEAAVGALWRLMGGRGAVLRVNAQPFVRFHVRFRTALVERSSSLTEDSADAHKLAEQAAADWVYASEGKPFVTRARREACWPLSSPRARA